GQDPQQVLQLRHCMVRQHYCHGPQTPAESDNNCREDNQDSAALSGVGDSGELTNSSLVLFGFCSQSAHSSASVSLDLANKKSSLEVLHPAAVHVSEEEEQGTITLTFDLPRSPSLMTNPVLLLAFESPLARGDLEAAFTSRSLQPNTQAVCISGDTQYVLLTGKSSEGSVNDRWQITAETKPPHMKQNLKSILIGEKSGSNISMSPLLFFSGGTGTDTRSGRLSFYSPPASLQTSFLCEMKRFLGAVLPQEHFASPPLPLDSLQSLPPLSLGLTSSQTLLAVMINSTAPTVFGFRSWGSVLPVCHGELALSAALLEELRQKLDQTLVQMTDIIREEETTHLSRQQNSPEHLENTIARKTESVLHRSCRLLQITAICQKQAQNMSDVGKETAHWHSPCTSLTPELTSSTTSAATKQRFTVNPFHGFGTSLRFSMHRIRS
uniref:Uncharacterized LOC102776677 n=1 Tax=Neolamprologus brichardi TaxID=32507 RepID=A0A3Q4MLJ2_NEOBR